MIENPNRVTPVVESGDEPARPAAIKVRRLPVADPEAVFDKMIHEVSARIVEVDAKLVESIRYDRRGVPQYDVQHYPSMKAMLKSPTVYRRIRERVDAGELRDLSERVIGAARKDAETLKKLRESARAEGRKLREVSDFALGLYDDEKQGVGTKYFKIEDTFLPGSSSPYLRQMLFQDVLDMHRKSWEAATRNPLGKRIVKIIPQFVLGRGVRGACASEKHQQAWDDFWQRNGMRDRTKVLLKDLITFGEIFTRYFRRPEGLVVRALDPSTIWDIVTDIDDIENVKYYHQQYTTAQQAPILTANFTPATLIIRQIPAIEVDHHAINRTSSEKRGRSELYAILSWLLRFKEFANDRLILNKMRGMFALDVSVEGDQSDVAAAESQFASPPGAGSVMVHNSTVAVEFKNANTNANEAKTDGELLLKIIAVGAGISEQFLGVSGASTRAGALIATEPDVKNFEDYREVVEGILLKASERVFKAKGLDSKQLMEFTFPALASEDRSAKLKDIALSEAMDYFSKRRAATMTAKEFDITNYDFEQEQEEIKKERGNEPLIAQGFQQQPKIAPDPMAMAEQPGLGQDLSPSAVDGGTAPKVAHTSGQMGFSAKALSGRNPANTKATLARGAFSRGTEKTSIAKRRSAGAPVKESRRTRDRLKALLPGGDE